ncbi:Ig-like domain-containing protein [Algibacter sp. 2305UL17-15]|uniref:Ig-like domain-containing protein n=1 Tax=Algibacter sp. 2305UL17-15 TaxID=3231268 RepID=UPI00345ADAC8
MMLKRIALQNRMITLLFCALFLSIISCSSNDSNSDEDPKEMPDDTPVATDDSLTVEENSVAGTANQEDVSTNDDIGDDGGDGDDYSLLSGPANGTVTEVSDGVFEYIPNADFDGFDSFTYTITDKDGDTDTAKVSITVNDVPDGPTAADFNNIDPAFPSFVSIDDTTPAGKKWSKLDSMSDEFDTWNVSKWYKTTWNYGVPVFMSTSSNNSGVTDGKLWIKATLNEANPEGRWFQSARIHSKTKTKYPMYTEARIKTSHISAYNTYWLNNGDINNRDEIDIIENNSKPSCTNCEAEAFPNQMNSQYFHVDSNKTPDEIRNKGNFLRSNLLDVNPLKNKGWNEDYHTYGVWWKDAKNIQFYLNGEPAGSVVVGEHNNGQTYNDRQFTRDLEIIFDLWTKDAPWLGGLPPKTDLADDSINTMRIDWVRTWKLENE